MGKNFEITPASRKAIDKALARLDAKRARQRKAATAKRLDLKQRREQERAAAKRQANGIGIKGEWKQPLYALPGWQVLVCRMEPGVWYDWQQVRELMAEFPRGSVKAWLWLKAVKAGAIERAGNPDFKPDPANPMETGARYLYAIAASATGKRQEWRSALGMADY